MPARVRASSLRGGVPGGSRRANSSSAASMSARRDGGGKAPWRCVWSVATAMRLRSSSGMASRWAARSSGIKYSFSPPRDQAVSSMGQAAISTRVFRHGRSRPAQSGRRLLVYPIPLTYNHPGSGPLPNCRLYGCAWPLVGIGSGLPAAWSSASTPPRRWATARRSTPDGVAGDESDPPGRSRVDTSERSPRRPCRQAGAGCCPRSPEPPPS